MSAAVADTPGKYKIRSVSEGIRCIEELEEKMHRHACDLEFEKAAQLRDEIKEIKQLVFE